MTLLTIKYPHISPYILYSEFLKTGLSWYAFMYIIGFTSAYFILQYRYKRGTLQLGQKADVGLLITDCAYGVILGARIFYVLVYNPRFYFEHPLQIFAVWNGGMSFHGGLIGGIIAMYLFARRFHLPLFRLLDALAMCLPIGLGFGRIGNFINGELYGRITNVPWAMVFPRGGPFPRHPSQLYESFLEGIVLGLIVYLVVRLKPREGILSAIVLVSYGMIRFFVEFFREPDEQLGTILGPFSMGQLLSSGMILGGIGLLVWLLQKKKAVSNHE